MSPARSGWKRGRTRAALRKTSISLCNHKAKISPPNLTFYTKNLSKTMKKYSRTMLDEGCMFNDGQTLNLYGRKPA